MSAIFGIGAAIVSKIFGLPRLAAVDEAMGTPLEEYSEDHGIASCKTSRPATEVLTPEEVNFRPNRVYTGHRLMFSIAIASPSTAG